MYMYQIDDADLQVAIRHDCLEFCTSVLLLCAMIDFNFLHAQILLSTYLIMRSII